MKPYFITLEGIEGAGKTTVIKQIIVPYLNKKNIDFITSREPGGTKIAEDIRQVLLMHHEEKMCSDTELLLMFASRAQHIAHVIKPALKQGKWVISDRFTDASYAYQGGGRNIPSERIAVLENWVQGDLRPDLVLVLDISPKVGLLRTKNISSLDRIESEQLDFFQRVRDCYLERARQNPQRYKVIDANQSLAKIARQIHMIFDEVKHA